MPLINEVMKLKNQGMSDQEIIKYLKDSGFSPLDISQALEQAKIKEVVSKDSNLRSQANQENQEQNSNVEEMQPSVIESEPKKEYGPYQETNQEYQQQTSQPAQMPQQTQAISEEAAPPQQVAYSPQETYLAVPQPGYAGDYQQEYGYQPYQQEMTTEIIEQITEEKIGRLKEAINSFENFRMAVEKKLKNLDERLKKIEDTIDKLQENIIKKIGSYGENLEDIKKEMEMMQESFSKTLPKLLKKKKTKK